MHLLYSQRLALEPGFRTSNAYTKMFSHVPKLSDIRMTLPPLQVPSLGQRVMPIIFVDHGILPHFLELLACE